MMTEPSDRSTLRRPERIVTGGVAQRGFVWHMSGINPQHPDDIHADPFSPSPRSP